MESEFIISTDYIELNKLLKASGLCSTGGHSKIIINDGLVKVDNEIETRVRRKIKNNMIVASEDQIIRVVVQNEG